MVWSEWVVSIADLLAMSATITAPTTATPSTVNDFNNILPRCVEFAEDMMLRDPDLDFLQMRTVDATTATSSGVRTLTVSSAVVVPFTLNLISPAGTANPESGTRNAVQRVSIDFLNALYPAATGTLGLPRYFAITDNALTAASTNLQARLAPTPDGAYQAEWYGMSKPLPFSAANPTTFMSINVPDLFLSASMVFMSGYQRDFGAQSDDPKMAVSWTALYQEQKRGAAIEQARLKAQSAGWTAYAPTPSATPPRM